MRSSRHSHRVKHTSGRDLHNNIVRVLDRGLRHFSDADLEGLLVVDGFHGRHCLKSVDGKGSFSKEWKKMEYLKRSVSAVMVST